MTMHGTREFIDSRCSPSSWHLGGKSVRLWKKGKNRTRARTRRRLRKSTSSLGCFRQIAVNLSRQRSVVIPTFAHHRQNIEEGKKKRVDLPDPLWGPHFPRLHDGWVQRATRCLVKFYSASIAYSYFGMNDRRNSWLEFKFPSISSNLVKRSYKH